MDSGDGGMSNHLNQSNFLVICMDQISAFSLGCNGNTVVQTPNMDRLAAAGVNFTRATCSNPVCMPNRASFITGLTPRQHGLLTNGSCLPTTTPTLGAALVEKGYRTHAAGKLHLQPVGPRQAGEGPESLESRARWASRELTDLPSPYYGYQTCDFTCGHVSGIHGHYGQWLEDNHPDVVPLWRRENAYHANGHAYRLQIPAELHYNHWIADRTIAFLEKVAGASCSGSPGAGSSGHTPFFLFCSFPDPHFPFAATRPYSERYDPADVELPATFRDREALIPFLAHYRATVGRNDAPDEGEMREIIAQTYGMISHVDDNIGRILDALETSGLAADTHVILTADHGEYLGSHNLIHKGLYPYESLWRIPFIWKAPGGVPRTCNSSVATVDFVPTICDLTGIDPAFFTARGFGKSEKLELPGQSLAPALRGASLPARPVLIEYDEDCHAGPLIRQRGLVDGAFKLVLYHGSEEGILINLGDDPDELTNLWDEPAYSAIRARMTEQLCARLIATERFDTPRHGWA